MRMIRRFRQNIFDNPFCQFAGSLVLFQDNEHSHARPDVRAGLSIHGYVHFLDRKERKNFFAGLASFAVHILIQKYGEIEIPGRVTMFGEQRGSLTAVLCAVIYHMQQTMP